MAQSRYLPFTGAANTEGSGFLSVSDITDSLALDFVNAGDTRVQSWLDSVDGELMSLAQERGAAVDQIFVPLHKKLLEYCKSYFCIMCFQDAFGRNDISQTNQETIKLKLDYYMQRCATMRKEITREMFLYIVSSIDQASRSSVTFNIFRS